MRAALILVCLLMAVAVASQWQQWQMEPSLVEFAPPTPTSKEGVEETAPLFEQPGEFQLPPQESYQVVLERPLFLESRKPVDADAEEVAGQAESPSVGAANLVLSAVVINGASKLALVQIKGEQNLLRLREGDEHEGWIVDSVAPDRLVLTLGEERKEYLLRVFESPPEPKPGKMPGAARLSKGNKEGRGKSMSQPVIPIPRAGSARELKR